MEKYIHNEQNVLWYELQGDYYIPCLDLPAGKEERHIGVWGQRHLCYIRQHKELFYTNLLTSGNLQSHLADVEEPAQELYDRLMKQRAECEGSSLADRFIYPSSALYKFLFVDLKLFPLEDLSTINNHTVVTKRQASN